MKYGFTNDYQEYLNSLSGFARAMRDVDWEYYHRDDDKIKTPEEIMNKFFLDLREVSGNKDFENIFH